MVNTMKTTRILTKSLSIFLAVLMAILVVPLSVYAEIFDFGEREDVESQAHVLFSLLRELDKLDFDKIFAPLPKADGVGLALYNRLIRASAYQIIRL